ncbi:MAG: hypothetical protein WD029_02995 [Microthrixaceae bacterium]
MDPLSSRSTASVPRVLAATALLGLLLGLLPSCSATAEKASAQMTSGMRPDAPAEDVFGGSNEFGNPGDLPDSTINEDLGDLGEQLDEFASGLGDLGDCAAVGLAYGQLLTLAYTSESPDAEIDKVLGELKASAPADLQKDLDLVAETLKSVDGSDFLEATNALSNPEFVKANEAIIDWIITQCGN